MAKKQEIEDIKESIRKPVPKEELTDNDFISSGSTLLDFALSERLNGGYKLGGIVQIYAEPHFGKTLFALEMIAKNSRLSRFEDYKFIFDEAESAMDFDLDGMFWEGLSDRIDFVYKDRTKPRTVQEWHNEITNPNNHPCVYVLDSLDALTTEDDLKQKNAPTKGGYHTEKALALSSTFPKIVGPIKKFKSLFFMVCQTRDNLGIGYETKSTSGGNAKDFYKGIALKLVRTGAIYKTIRGNKHEIGYNLKVTITKNKITGKKREIEIPIYNNYGINDVESIIDWLIKNNFIEMSGAWVDPKGMLGIEKKFYKTELVVYIQQNNLYEKLRKFAFDAWMQVESELMIPFESKFSFDPETKVESD